MLYHLVSRTWAQGGRTGVPRFDYYIGKAFPDLVSITPQDKIALSSEDVVITDNHLGLEVPEDVPCVVVHHGCAPYHYHVDPVWRNDETLRMAADQRRVLKRPNTVFVAPSAWVMKEFSKLADESYPSRAFFIPHWVPEIPAGADGPRIWRGPRVIGDWRTQNKGSEIWPFLASSMPDFEFAPLKYDENSEEARRQFYRNADVYLCLSLSEGCPYSVLDAEAASLHIVTTETGSCHELAQGGAIMIRDRNDVAEIQKAITQASLRTMRRVNMFRSFHFASWRAAWEDVIAKARK
jgi:hypothetical protein